MTKLLALVLAAACLFSGCKDNYAPVRDNSQPIRESDKAATVTTKRDEILADAFRSRRSNLQVQGEGTVSKVLPDDTNGSRHQRFLVKLNSGQTVLIAHNIDLAPRVLNLKQGDPVQFYGEYEWNEKGGVIHWTHRDPQGRHLSGWIKYRGRMYQ